MIAALLHYYKSFSQCYNFHSSLIYLSLNPYSDFPQVFFYYCLIHSDNFEMIFEEGEISCLPLKVLKQYFHITFPALSHNPMLPFSKYLYLLHTSLPKILFFQKIEIFPIFSQGYISILKPLNQ